MSIAGEWLPRLTNIDIITKNITGRTLINLSTIPALKGEAFAR